MTMFENVGTPEILDVDSVKAKYNGNVDELAKGYAHADKHIKELQSKLDAETAKASKGKTLEEVLEALRVSQNSQGTVTPPGNSGVVENKDAPTMEQMVADILGRQKAQDEAKRNRDQVAQLFIEKFKDKAPDQFSKVATDSGFSVEALQELASRNPKAVLKLAGLDQMFNANQSGPTKGSVNPQALQATRGPNGAVGTNSYWVNFRKENPSKWQTNDVQAQIRADFDRDPDFFLNN